MLVWISSPVRSKKPVLMNTTRSFAARMHSFRLTVVRRSSSMMPILRVFRLSPRASSIRCEQLDRGGDFLRPMLLRLDDINASRPAVAILSLALEIVNGGQRRDHGVEKTFGDLLAALSHYGVGIHVHADIAHQQQASSGQSELSSGRRGEDFVRIEPSGERAAVLFECRLQRSFHEAAPMCDRPQPCRRRPPPRPHPRNLRWW